MERCLHLKTELKFRNAEDTSSTIFHNLQPGKGIKLLRGGTAAMGERLFSKADAASQRSGNYRRAHNNNIENPNAPLEGTV